MPQVVASRSFLAPRRSRATGGFTTIELLVVVAIIGVLASVLLVVLLGSRSNAMDRAALVHVHNVYKASYAHVAEQSGNSVVVGDCARGYTAGRFSVSPPGAVASCTVSDDGGEPEVRATSKTGASISLP